MNNFKSNVTQAITIKGLKIKKKTQNKQTKKGHSNAGDVTLELELFLLCKLSWGDISHFTAMLSDDLIAMLYN